MSNHRLRFIPQARRDLQAAERFTLREWGLEQRLALNQRFDQTFRRLLAFPELGRQRPDLGPSLRTLPCARYVIVYRVDDLMVTVIRVIHERQMLTTDAIPSET